jgi:hypothetical protein
MTARRHLIATLACAFTLALAPLTSMASTTVSKAEAEKIAASWTRAINGGALNEWLNLHAENIEFADFEYHKGSNREDMRKWGQALINAGGAYKITRQRIEGTTLVWLFEYKDRGFSTKGQGRLLIENGKIRRLTFGAAP